MEKELYFVDRKAPTVAVAVLSLLFMTVGSL